MWVKICGLRSRQEVEWAAAAGADAVGFVFAPSRRWVSPEEAAAWGTDLPSAVERVGVFLDRRADVLADIAQRARLTTLQVHGGPPEGNGDLLRGYRIIRVAAVESGDSEASSEFPRGKRPPCPEIPPGERLLLDRRQGEQAGGTGMVADWALAADWARLRSLILAGGLSPDNLEAALRQVRPWGVDVSSGVESSGRKDRGKIEAFIRLAKKGGIDHDNG